MLKLKQVDYKTQQEYNKRIAKLLDSGYTVYIAAYMLSGTFNIKYKVTIGLHKALQVGGYRVELLRFKPGNKVFWGRDVEAPVEKALLADEFMQALYKAFRLLKLL